MKTLILIFLVAAFSCTETTKQNSLLNTSSEIWSDTIPDWDFDNIENRKIQYTGEWKHMSDSIDGKTGSFPFNDQSIAYYHAWMFGFDIYAELMEHHNKVIVSVDGVDLNTINVKDDRNLMDQLIY